MKMQMRALVGASSISLLVARYTYTLGSEEEFGFYPANGWMKIHSLYLKNTVQCCGGGVES